MRAWVAYAISSLATGAAGAGALLPANWGAIIAGGSTATVGALLVWQSTVQTPKFIAMLKQVYDENAARVEAANARAFQAIKDERDAGHRRNAEVFTPALLLMGKGTDKLAEALSVTREANQKHSGSN